jgi:hypothetical protein
MPTQEFNNINPAMTDVNINAAGNNGPSYITYYPLRLQNEELS